MAEAHEITPEDAKAYAVLRDRDGKVIRANTQAEVDEAVKNGATADGPTWGPKRNRTEMRRFGKFRSIGRGMDRRATAADQRAALAADTLITPVDGNGRAILPARPVTADQMAKRVQHAAKKAARVPWRRPRRNAS